MTTAGMTLVAVDANGRLSEFHSVPSPRSSDAPANPTDWNALFAAAGLQFDQFTPTKPEITPPYYADERRAWEGPLPDRPEHTVRIEAAATAGRPVYFALAGPWSRSARSVSPPASLFSQIVSGLAGIIMPALMVLGAALARINLKAGRGDRDGAFRVATFIFGTSFLAWVLGTSHIPAVGNEIGRIFHAVGRGLFDAGVLWLTYLGLEPYVRRYSPDSLLGWTKLVAGHWRDPRVGVDLIVGVSAGLAMTLLYAVHNALPPLVGFAEPMPLISNAQALNGLRHIFSAIAFQLTDAVNSGMLGVAGVVGFVLLLRNRAACHGWRQSSASRRSSSTGCSPAARRASTSPSAPGSSTIYVLTIVRAGLLSAVAALFTHFVLLRAPITTDFSSWHATTGLWHAGIVLALGLGACYYARNGQGERVTTS